MSAKDEVRPLDLERLDAAAQAARWVALFGTREQIIAYGFLPQTAEAIVLVRECFTGAWW